MKDERLEKEFDEYFKGANISNDIIADAKKSVKPKRRILPRILKFASVAASIVLVFAVAVTFMARVDWGGLFPDGGMSNTGSSPSPPSDGNDDGTDPKFELYTDSDLIQSNQNAYTVASLHSSLKFIENFAYNYNSTVETCKAGYKDGNLALVTAEVSILSELNRDETTVFVEFTDVNLIYAELADYYCGNTYKYHGAQYYLTTTQAENGEPEYKLHVLFGGVKYYFSVRSSEVNAYRKYLDIITSNNF